MNYFSVRKFLGLYCLYLGKELWPALCPETAKMDVLETWEIGQELGGN